MAALFFFLKAIPGWIPVIRTCHLITEPSGTKKADRAAKKTKTSEGKDSCTPPGNSNA